MVMGPRVEIRAGGFGGNFWRSHCGLGGWALHIDDGERFGKTSSWVSVSDSLIMPNGVLGFAGRSAKVNRRH